MLERRKRISDGLYNDAGRQQKEQRRELIGRKVFSSINIFCRSVNAFAVFGNWKEITHLELDSKKPTIYGAINEISEDILMTNVIFLFIFQN